MSDTKTYVFGNEGSGMMNMLAPFLSQRGLDPNMVFAMMQNKGGQGWENNGMWWIIILFFLLWGRNGWGNDGNNGNNGACYGGLANLINDDKSAEMIMSAIQGNATALSQLATTLNCDVNSIQTAINGLGGQVCQVGNQVGLTSQQVINALQLGNMSIVQQLSTCCCDIKTQMASCCCDVKDAITRSNYENQLATVNQTNSLQNSINFVNSSVERGFAQTGYETLALTCAILNTINQGIQRVIDGQAAAELRELQAKISKQNDDLASYKTAGIISQQLAPINGMLGALKSEIDSVKCKLPETVTTAYSPFTAVPNCIAWNYGLGFNNNLFGSWGNGNWA